MSAQIQILLVEDSADDALLVTRALTRGHPEITVVRVEGAEALRAALARQRWDVVLSDWAMPGFNALGALVIVRAHHPDLPFIIVSGTIGEELAVVAMRAGANDYVLKDKLARLAPAIEREIRETRLRDTHRVEVKRFAQLVASGMIGILTVTTGGAILDANDAYLKMIGYTREDLAARSFSWQDLMPADQAEVTAERNTLLATQGFAPP